MKEIKITNEGRVISKANINRWGRKKHITNQVITPAYLTETRKWKSALTILTAFILFGLALTLTSCKNCSKDEPVNRGGGTADTDKIPVTLTLDDKRKAVEKLVRDVEAECKNMKVIMEQKSASQAMKNQDDNLARENMEALTRAMEKVQAKVGEVKAEVVRLNIDGEDPVVHALVAKADSYAARAVSCRSFEWKGMKQELALRRVKVNAWARVKWKSLFRVYFMLGWYLDSSRQQLAQDVTAAQLDEDDVNAIMEFVDAKDKWRKIRDAEYAADSRAKAAVKAMTDAGFPPIEFDY
jgi:hypothetical protein